MAWYKEWKSADGSYESKDFGDYITPIKGLLEKRRFLDILRNFIFFEHKDEGTTKIMAQYHQYFAVHKAVRSTLEAIKKGDGRGEFSGIPKDLARACLWFFIANI